MQIARFRLTALALTGAFVLSGCAYDMYGDPYGYGYGSGVSVGIGYGGGYGGYGGYYGGYGYGYPYGGGYYDPFGWYGDFYYPGTGIFVYDSFRRQHRWSGDQQRYWMGRRSNWQGRTGTTWHRDNWSGFNRSGATTTTTTTTGGHWHHRG